jgi:hypothetical protein
MPSGLHHELTMAAEREHISLNRYVTEALAASLSAPGGITETENQSASAEAVQDATPQRRRSFRMLLAANMIVMLSAAAAAIALVILALERGI